jgi:aminoglycoside phosphotransferase (APT) family kinase protein
LADVGLLAIYWTEAADDEPIFPRSPTVVDGFAHRDEALARYAEISKRDLTGIGYYIAFGYWRLACISAGVWARYQSGAFGSRLPYPGLETQAQRCVARAAAALERL